MGVNEQWTMDKSKMLDSAKKNFQSLHVSYSLSSELAFSDFQISEDQIFRKRRMTGTNHSKTNEVVEDPSDRS